MNKLEDISTAELLFDRQECFNDIILCVAAIMGAGLTGTSEIKSRLHCNQEMIMVITEECKRRGFDPAKYQGIK